jgi:hypothetical protein
MVEGGAFFHRKVLAVKALTQVRARITFAPLAPSRALGHAPAVPLTHQERLFIDHRRSRRHIGLYLLPVFLLIVLAAWAGLFLLWPTSVNPKAVWGAVEAGTIICGSGTLSGYATTATVLANVVLLLIASTLVLRMAWSSNERRYLRLIEKLEKEASVPSPAPPVPATPVHDRPVRQ